MACFLGNPMEPKKVRDGPSQDLPFKITQDIESPHFWNLRIQDWNQEADFCFSGFIPFSKRGVLVSKAWNVHLDHLDMPYPCSHHHGTWHNTCFPVVKTSKTTVSAQKKTVCHFHDLFLEGLYMINDRHLFNLGCIISYPSSWCVQPKPPHKTTWPPSWAVLLGLLWSIWKHPVDWRPVTWKGLEEQKPKKFLGWNGKRCFNGNSWVGKFGYVHK